MIKLIKINQIIVSHESTAYQKQYLQLQYLHNFTVLSLNDNRLFDDNKRQQDFKLLDNGKAATNLPQESLSTPEIAEN